jgi:predicted GNAT family acetyltransferase
MAGERLHLSGLTEVSAVSTDPDHRRQGLAELLVRTVAAGITDRGETPFLHADVSNVGAIRLYRAMGFTLRRQVTFTVLRSPA